jgi:hypothetical protein
VGLTPKQSHHWQDDFLPAKGRGSKHSRLKPSLLLACADTCVYERSTSLNGMKLTTRGLPFVTAMPSTLTTPILVPFLQECIPRGKKFIIMCLNFERSSSARATAGVQQEGSEYSFYGHRDMCAVELPGCTGMHSQLLVSMKEGVSRGAYSS